MQPLKQLIALSVLSASTSSLALPFMPLDARGMAMGNTGVASARLAHAPAYNPALLTQVQADDDFAILLPQFGVILADEGDVVKTGNTIKNTIFPKYEQLFSEGSANNFSASLKNMKTTSSALNTSLENAKAANDAASASAAVTDLKAKNSNFRGSIDDFRAQIKKMNEATAELNSSLGNISSNPLRVQAAMATAFAFPAYNYTFAMSIRDNLHVSARTVFTQKDRNLFAAYGLAAEGYTKGAYALPDSIDTAITSLETFAGGGAAPNPADFDNLKGKSDGVSTYNSDEVNTAGGNIRIMKNGELSAESKNPQLDSNIQFAAINILELGFSGAHEFKIKDYNVSFGITPKILYIETFHYGTSMQNKSKIDSSAINNARSSYVDVNLDLGASYRFPQYPSWLLGASIKNLIPKSYKTKDTDIKDENGIVIDKLSGPTLKVYPQLRVGGSYTNDWFVGSVDLDITENKPTAFEIPTRFLAFGAEFDLYDSAQFRLGARSNLRAPDPLKQSTLSVGFGLSPSILEFNLAAIVNPSDFKRELGLALELGMAF